MSVEVDIAAACFVSSIPSGKTLLQESPRVPRRYVPQQVNGERVYRVEQRFYPDALEGIYGLGQHQSGVFDQRGTVVELAQANTNVAIPLFVSTLGYGLLWNTASKSWFDNRFPTELKLTAEAADAIDYYVFYGPSIDRIIQHLSQHDRPCAALRPLGVWLRPVEGPLPLGQGAARCRRRVSASGACRSI